jgi:NAD(P)-dependent dehydrogenase (short-subunit alcohol dehydrogenase family)
LGCTSHPLAAFVPAASFRGPVYARAAAEPYIPFECLAQAPRSCGKRDTLDVADETAVADLFRRLRAEWGGLDVLCANAGIAGPTATVENVDIAEWRRCVPVNLDGAFLFAKLNTLRR